MAARRKTTSPLLATAGSLIADASAQLVRAGSRFRHSFEADVAAILPDPEQPRRHFDAAALAGLAASMAAQGQLQPVLLRPDPAARGRWVLVAGERRWRAARDLGWTTLLAIETDGDADVLGLLENLQRTDLSPVEEAQGLRRLLDRRGWSQDRAAEALGRSKSEISAALRILTLPAPLLDEAQASDPPLTRNALVELARLEAPAREALLARAPLATLTVQAVRAAARPRPVPDPASERAAPVPTLARQLDAATAAIERAIRHGVPADPATRAALERLSASAEALLRGLRRQG